MSKQISEAQKEHLGQILYFFASKYRPKYTDGAIEHDGNLWELSDDELLEMALEEVLDLVSYLTTLIKNRKDRDGRKG